MQNNVITWIPFIIGSCVFTRFYGFHLCCISTFYCSQFYILFRYKDICTQKVVLKATATASQYSTGKNPAICGFSSFLGRKSELWLYSQIARYLVRSHLNDKQLIPLWKWYNSHVIITISPAFSLVTDNLYWAPTLCQSCIKYFLTLYFCKGVSSYQH